MIYVWDVLYTWATSDLLGIYFIIFDIVWLKDKLPAYKWESDMLEWYLVMLVTRLRWGGDTAAIDLRENLCQWDESDWLTKDKDN